VTITPSVAIPAHIQIGTTVTFAAAGNLAHGIVPINNSTYDWTYEGLASSSATYAWTNASGNGSSASKQFSGEGLNQTVTVTYTRREEHEYTVKRTCGTCRTTQSQSQKIPVMGRATALVKVNVYTLTLQVRRKGGGSFGNSADIAAGGLGSDVHFAEIEAKLKPTPASGTLSSLPFAVKITGDPNHRPAPFEPHPPDDPPQDWLEWNGNDGYEGTITATRSGYLCECLGPLGDDGHATTVRHYYELASSPKKDTGSAISITDASVGAVGADVNFLWADDPQWDDDPLPPFTPGEYEEVILTDLAVDGVNLDGHTVWVYPVKVDVAHFEWIPSSRSHTWTPETILRTETDDLSAYVSIAIDESGEGDGNIAVVDGKVKVYQLVPASVPPAGTPATGHIRLGSVVTRVYFKAADMNVLK